MTEAATADNEPDSLDRIAAELLVLKEGLPISYAEIVRRVGQNRIDRGVSPSAAFPPRSTIYDAFRSGRARMDPVLLRDIVSALGVSAGEADGWVERCLRVQRTRPVARPLSVTRPADLRAGSLDASVARPWWSTPALLVGCVLLNLVGIVVVQQLHLPIYLDMAGTAAAAIMLGPWHGAAVGLASNLFGFVVGAPGAAPFALVNVAGALVWGYGIRRFRMGDDIVRFFNLNLLVATACSLVGAPLGVILFGGYSGHGSDTVTASIETMGLPVVAAAFSSNILTSVIDKLLTGFVALMIFVWLHRAAGFSAARMPLVEQLSAPARRRQG
ncbi:hypothetical protein N1028_18630 [Herbiconiux sp. CPCC 203407]|uniref:ECF transporter S component n=1 Tax=Herbiconiux oxytropis TaxID=2970915 RepID=A0AA41XJE2_9MICO|nr:hypothetical protein [Herbiconiux oxytropis]MCS5723435.1 hypothetical protein [Herbiconiux oxytropis]MCS5727918.1 hypothetical protein [Herbiconiux oxytropis]